MLITDLVGLDINSWDDTAGTLSGWQEAVTALFAPGCEAQSFAVLAAFAAPLMGLWKRPTGGSVVSLVGPRRSGRSTALDAAASVWGTPERMKLQSYVGERKYEQLASFGYLPVIADRLPNMAPEGAMALIKRFAAGDDGAWSTMILTAGGAPIMTEAGYAVLPGIELPIAVPGRLIEPRDKRALAAQMISNRGHAGLRFLRDLTAENAIWLARRALVSKYAGLGDTYGAAPEAEITRRTIAAVAVAGEMVVALGLIEFDPERICAWAAKSALSAVAA